MAIETHTTCAAAHEALNKIEKLAAPGQELNITQAIDLICDIYNACRSARTVTKFDATNGANAD